MSKTSEFSRRERQIKNTVFVRGAATVNHVVEVIRDTSTALAVRRMMHILEEEGHLNRRSISAAIAPARLLGRLLTTCSRDSTGEPSSIYTTRR